MSVAENNANVKAVQNKHCFFSAIHTHYSTYQSICGALFMIFVNQSMLPNSKAVNLNLFRAVFSWNFYLHPLKNKTKPQKSVILGAEDFSY